MKTPEGFTPWNGGECPVDGDAMVECYLRDESLLTGLAWLLKWPSFGGAGDIIAYRVINPPIDHAEKLAEALEQIANATTAIVEHRAIATAALTAYRESLTPKDGV